MGSGIKGFKSQKILKSKLNGYTEQESVDPERYATIQELTGDKHGLDTVIHGLFKYNLLPVTALAGSNIRTIIATTHGASKGDAVRFIVSGIESSILSVPDANTIILGSELSFDPTGLTFDTCRHITPAYNVDGSLNVAVVPAPIAYNRRVAAVTSSTTVLDDIDTPVNSRPLPTELIFGKDGVPTKVTYDTVTPTNSNAVPVNIVTVNGTGIETTVNLSGAQINVQLSHTGASPDSTRIGDGTNLMGVNASLEALVHDTDALAALVDVNTELNTQTTALNDINAELDTQTTALNDVNTELNTQTTALGNINTELDTQTTALGNIETNQTDGTQITQIADAGGDIADIKLLSSALDNTDKGIVTNSVLHGKKSMGGGPDFVDVKVTPSGSLLVEADIVSSALPTGAATEATLAAMSAKLPASLGSKADAASLAVTQSTEDKAAIGSLTETAPATDIASSGLNGRLQRIAQRLSSLIALFPSSIGAKAGTDSLSVIPATDAKFLTKPFTTTTTYAENLALTTVTTITAPANSVGVIIMADDGNANNVRVRQGGVAASLTSGFPLQAGRDIKFDCGTDLSVISDNAGSAGASVKVYFQWYVQA
jgi:hypothetical protein